MSAVLLGESVLLLLTHRSTAVRLDRMERGLLVSLVILVCSPSRGVSRVIITQDPGSVTGTEEGEVTLPCTVTGAPPGPVRWYRDTGSGRQYLYSTSPPPNERNDPRVSEVHQNHPTDTSIRIVNLNLRDSGTYYCEKYRVFDGSLVASGSGSRLSVRAIPALIITQDPGSVTGTEEGEVTVPCTVTGGPAGPVRWYRDTGSGRQYLYSPSPPLPNESNDPRVSRVHPDHPTDLSIRIVNLTLSDSGTYYCEKYRGFLETLIASGSGTRLSVREPPCSSNLFLVSVFLLVKLALLAAINAFLFVLLKLEQRRLKRVDAE